MAVLEYVDRPGEIRAARPPSNLQKMETLQQVLESLGISDDRLVDTENDEVDENSNDRFRK
jgi:hypothetical protein